MIVTGNVQLAGVLDVLHGAHAGVFGTFPKSGNIHVRGFH